jgi:prepilin-type N-terminal cleavage/methylation domain-containing protein
MDYNCQKGFTLIELITVMAILAIIFVSVLANYQNNKSEQALTQAVQKMVTDLREAQNMAMSGSEINSQYYGYGIYINIGVEGSNNSYIVFGETQPDSHIYDSATDIIIRNTDLPSGVKIQAVSSSDGRADIFFEPPDPKVYLNVLPASNQATITLQNSSALARVITVNNSGLIQNN